jgi:hypothetical protein
MYVRTESCSKELKTCLLKDFAAQLRSQLDAVPSEFREGVMIEFSGRQEFDDGDIEVTATISYDRPETPEEEKWREGGTARRAAQREMEERYMLVELKAKYEGGAS